MPLSCEYVRATAASVPYSQAAAVCVPSPASAYVAHTFGRLHYVVPMVAVQNQTHTRRKLSNGIRRLIRMQPENRAENARHWAQHCGPGMPVRERTGVAASASLPSSTPPLTDALAPSDNNESSLGSLERVQMGTLSTEKRLAFRQRLAAPYFASVASEYAASRQQTGRKRLPPTELARREPGRHIFDPFEPEWECPKREMVPFRWGDGHKWMCDPAKPRASDCLIYSFGARATLPAGHSVQREGSHIAHTSTQGAQLHVLRLPTSPRARLCAILQVPMLRTRGNGRWLRHTQSARWPYSTRKRRWSARSAPHTGSAAHGLASLS